MIRNLSVACLLLLASVGAASLAAEPAQQLALKSGTIAVDGKSTVHPWTISADRFTVSGVPAVPLVNATDALRPGALSELTFEVPVRNLKGKEEGINKNTYKALNADVHPVISFRMRDYTVLSPSRVTAIGTLTINGVDRDIQLSLDTKATDAGLEITGQKPLLMTDFGVKPPTAMMGMIKSSNEIVVRFSFVLTMQEVS